MRSEKNSTGISVGSSSILVIFVVLCLTSFATFSLVLARADYKLTQKTAQAATEFYAADAKAELYLKKLHTNFAQTDNSSPKGQVLIDDTEISYEAQNNTAVFFYDVAINDIKNLHVEVSAELGSDGRPTGSFRRLCWKVQLAQDWQDQGQMNLAEFGNLPKF